MTAAASAATGAAQGVSLRRMGGPKSGRGRRRDKAAGTLLGQAFDGVEEIPGPGGWVGSLWREIISWFQGLSRDFPPRGGG